MKSSKQKVLIIGYPGQDGQLLFNLLTQRNYKVLALGIASYYSNFDFILKKQIEITNYEDVFKLIDHFRPDEIYYLAAFHSSSEVNLDKSIRESFQRSIDVHVYGIMNVLEAITQKSIQTKVFYASSSMIFSGQDGSIQDESTPLNPQGLYGITKATGTLICRQYRKEKNIHCSVGILYNHESALRPPDFLSQKIIRTALSIKQGNANELIIGNLEARVDWGYAPDYVEAFTRILKLDQADDFIMATGESHSVREFVSLVFDRLNLDWRKYVIENGNILERVHPEKIGNPAKLKRMTQWEPSMSFEDMVYRLIDDTQLVLLIEN